jgi:hypothetical protein
VPPPTNQRKPDTPAPPRSEPSPPPATRLIGIFKGAQQQARNLTVFERAAGWRYSFIVTNIPVDGGVPGVPGSYHAQFTGVLHRQHAVVEDGVLAAKSMGLRNLPSKTWVVILRVGAGCQPRR